MKKKQYDDDDNRTIADMNVEGMPWYVPKDEDNKPTEKIQLSKEERRAMGKGVFMAVLVTTVVFVSVFFLVILLLTRVWN